MKADTPAVLQGIRDVSRETLDRLEAYRAVLERWQSRTNLVGANTLSAFWSHHVADAAFLLSVAPDERYWLDVGSGAGLPGLVIAALLAEGGEGGSVVSVEANARKCAFQRTAVLEMGLRGMAVTVDIRNTRLEDCGTVGDAVLTARAFAPTVTVLDHAARLRPRRLLLLKGERHADELSEAGKRYDVDCTVHPHPIRPGSVALDITAFAPIVRP